MHDGVKAKEVMSKGYEKPKQGSVVYDMELGKESADQWESPIDMTKFKRVDITEGRTVHVLSFNTAQALIFGKALRKAAIQYQLEGDDDTARYLFGLCDGLLKLL